MSDLIDVGVSGFLGRMGSQVVQAVREAPDMEYVGGADTACEQPSSAPVEVGSVDEFLTKAKPDVVVEFSVPSAVMANAKKILEAGVNCVIGTTGISPEQREELGQIAHSNDVGVLVAPNFAVGAVLMMEFAKQAAPYFSGVEVIELHHDKKVDSPSGTALMTAGKIAEAWKGLAACSAGQPARGQDCAGIQVHSVRLPGLVAHQEVLFGNTGETLTIRHDSLDRKSFMPGVLLGIRKIIGTKGLVFGLENFIFE